MSGGKFSMKKTLLYSMIGLYISYGIARANGLLKKKSVNGKHIFITGAGSGIGREMAKAFANRGALVIFFQINLSRIFIFFQIFLGQSS